MATTGGIYKRIFNGQRPAQVAHIRTSRVDRAFRIFCYSISTVWVLFVLFPIVWLVGSTFKDPVDVMKMPPDLLPRAPLQYTVRLDFSDVAGQEPGQLER
ncbi:MAG: hypothetical protein M1546_09545, partial [Chloroflexi bacterium]|nr:hypothetical protein [Chloroflexota bacterium]